MTLLLKRSAIALLVTTALGACVSEMPRFPIEPGPTAFQPAFTQVDVKAEARGQARSNRVKYRDTGLKPGRVPGGLIEARALRGSDGMTTIEATTGTFDEGPALARIEKILVKVRDSGLPAYNDRPQSRTWSRTVPHLAVGDQLELTAHVRYASAAGNHVVTWVIPVGRRPDLAVNQLAGPPSSYVNAPTIFIATIVERNGQVGARANCLLSVDDIAVDQATRIWVDANGVVSCEFTYIFHTVGEHDVAVSLTGVSPTDDNLTNNTATRSINVVTPGTPIPGGTIRAQDEAYTKIYVSQRTGAPAPDSSEQRQYVSGVSFSGQADGVDGNIAQIVTRLSTDGREITSSTLDQFSLVEFDDGITLTSCIRYRHNGESADSCRMTNQVTGASSTSFFYSHTSGEATYYGQTIYCMTQSCDSYIPIIDNFGTVSGSGQRYGIGVGGELRVELAFIDAAGLQHTVDRSVSFADESAPYNYNISVCEPYPLGGDICIRDSSQGTVWRGFTQWEPPLVP